MLHRIFLILEKYESVVAFLLFTFSVAIGVGV